MHIGRNGPLERQPNLLQIVIKLLRLLLFVQLLGYPHNHEEGVVEHFEELTGPENLLIKEISRLVEF